ncbi:MAG TPA: PHB depolymerase family esterase [Dehalococcoidia bacterium]|nr:PHB depolymerase family esterase [Dehalococcoidia bacterium]
MIRILLALCAIPAALFAIACSSGGSRAALAPNGPPGSPSATAAAGCRPLLAHDAGSFSESLTSGGVDRTYILYVPAGYDGGRRLPLVVAYPGYAQPADSLAAYDGLDPLADASGFVVVTPNAAGNPQFWNEGKSAALADDVQFTKDLLAKVEQGLCIDAARVYLTGYSNGGGMALRAACEMPAAIAAVGVVSAYYPNCAAAVPLIAFHGTSDPVVPFEGGASAVFPGVTFPVVRRSVSEWARTLGCDGLPRISRPSQAVELSTFLRCNFGDGEAQLYTIIGGGHTWPGATLVLSPLLGMTTAEVKASPTMWAFFVAHALPH